MQILHSLVVVTVTSLNILASNVDLPKVLGTKIAENTVNVETNVDASSSSGIRLKTSVQTRTANTIRKTYEIRKAEILEEREATRERIEAKIEEAKLKFDQRREDLKEKLEEMKDQRKAKIAENVLDRIENVNEKWVNHWTRVLDRLEEILAKLETRVVDYDGDKDTSDLIALIDEAQSEVDTARLKVNQQASKTYVFEVESEESLGEDVSSLVAEFKGDIESVWQSIKVARESVHDVFLEVKKFVNDK